MFAYDYLKENPQQRDALIKHNWKELFTDEAVPYAVKEELKELASFPLNDAVLFWHKFYLEDVIIHGPDRDMDDMVWHSLWLQALYNLVVKDIDDDPRIDQLCWHMIKRCIAYDDTLPEVQPLDVVRKMMLIYRNEISTHRGSMWRICCLALTSIEWQVATGTSIGASECKLVMEHFTNRFISSITKTDQLREAIQLLGDSDYDENIKFNSWNELERAHNKRTERVTEEMMKTVGGRGYLYKPEFIELVKQCPGILVPTGPASLIKRGEQHHNCVGTYSGRHTAAPTGKWVSRLFFTKDATCEMKFEIDCKNRIVSTQIPQFKGAYNRDVLVPYEFEDLRIAFTGKPASILIVKEVKDDK